jgi:hypothetical protein
VFATSQAFSPTAKDQNKLSAYDSSVFSAKGSYDHFIQENESYGVLGLIVEQCQTEGLPVICDDEPFKGHASIDYSPCKSKGEIKTKAKKLCDMAMERNWLYPTNTESDGEAK